MKIARQRLRRYEIAHSSMTPTLEPGDYVVAVRAETFHRGDIVISTHPVQPNLDVVKRVVALPHERLEITHGIVFVNGSPLEESWSTGTTEPDGLWDLGEEIFVLGDQRHRSTEDSRTLGPIPLNQTIWRVWFRYWPLGRISAPR